MKLPTIASRGTGEVLGESDVAYENRLTSRWLGRARLSVAQRRVYDVLAGGVNCELVPSATHQTQRHGRTPRLAIAYSPSTSTVALPHW